MLNQDIYVFAFHQMDPGHVLSIDDINVRQQTSIHERLQWIPFDLYSEIPVNFDAESKRIQLQRLKNRIINLMKGYLIIESLEHSSINLFTVNFKLLQLLILSKFHQLRH